MEKQLSIVESIRAAYYSLTGAEKKVADFVLANPELVQDMSITQLADECGVADATVSRFCRSLQTKGFSSFKLELARLTASNAAKEEISPRGDTTEGRCAESVRTANESIQQTFDLLKPKQVKKLLISLTVLPVSCALVPAVPCFWQISVLSFSQRPTTSSSPWQTPTPSSPPLQP